MYKLIPRIFKKNNQKKSPKIVDRYKDLRKTRTKEKKILNVPKFRIKKGFFKNQLNRNVVFQIFIGIFCLVGVGFATYSLRFVSYFSVSSIDIQSNQPVGSALLNEYYGRNLFSLNASDVENTIEQNVLFTNSVYVIKSLPNKLEVKIQTDVVLYVLIFFDGYCVYTDSGEFLDCNSADQLQISDQEYNLVAGRSSVDDQFVKESYIQSLPEEERVNVKWEEVDVAKKFEIYNNLRVEASSKVEGHFQNIQNKILEENKYSALQTIQFEAYGVNPDLDSVVGISVPRSEVTDLVDISRNILDSDILSRINITKLRWSGVLSAFVVETDTGLNIIFSKRRSIEKQIIDLESIVNSTQFEGLINSNRTIDLRGDRVKLI